MSNLALLGGTPVREKLFPAHKFIAKEEKAAVSAVVETGILSRYIGAQHPDFMGGPQVKAFEEAWAEGYRAEHAVAMNSATSGLFAAAGAAAGAGSAGAGAGSTAGGSGGRRSLRLPLRSRRAAARKNAITATRKPVLYPNRSCV